MKNYSATLSNPLWQKKRLEIFSRDGFKCVECMSENKTLHVHHISYSAGKKPWEYPDSNLITLCWQCHESKGSKKFPQKGDDLKEWKNKMKRAF